MNLANYLNPNPYFTIITQEKKLEKPIIKVLEKKSNCIKDDYYLKDRLKRERESMNRDQNNRTYDNKRQKKYEYSKENDLNNDTKRVNVNNSRKEFSNNVVIEEVDSEENDDDDNNNKKNKAANVVNKKKDTYKLVYFVLVLDYDLTLVDKNSVPYPSSFKFIKDINFLEKKNVIFKPFRVLWSLGSEDYVKASLKKHFKISDFDRVKTNDSKMSVRQKHIVPLKKDLSKLKSCEKHLSGPVVIIDDQKKNLNSKEFEIPINVSKYYIYKNDKDDPIDVNYDLLLKHMINKLHSFFI